MGRMEIPAESLDVFGIPEYRVTLMQSEIVGSQVRIAFGDRRFGQVQWYYTVLIAPTDLLAISKQCETLALEAMHISDLLGTLAMKGH